MTGPLERYQTLVTEGALAPDAAQAAAAARLDALSRELAALSNGGSLSRLFSRASAPPNGLYLWGAVGRGKSLLMDIFFNNTLLRRKRRVHFHEFMAETHERIAKFRNLDERARKKRPGANARSIYDPIAPVAHDIASEARLLCFDEFQVADIANAMLLGRLFEALFQCGATVVATSNRAPDELYKDGLNRQLFLPFIELLKSRLDILHLDAARDYRLESLDSADVYFSPPGDNADNAIDHAWRRLIAGAHERSETIVVKGREIIIPRAARGAARFSFADLCARPLGAGDYLAIVRRYAAVFIDNVPCMGPDRRNEAKRFVTLIDAIYDTRTKLVCTAQAEPFELYPQGDGAFEFERTASRLMEMRTTQYLSTEKRAPEAN